MYVKNIKFIQNVNIRVIVRNFTAYISASVIRNFRTKKKGRKGVKSLPHEFSRGDVDMLKMTGGITNDKNLVTDFDLWLKLYKTFDKSNVK